ncbi:hypothetical protein AB0F81_43880 [Actinoplanes sp. NPDC024001]|uniref:hypothetical protein n=1 Tax=Actinoplanes sp. NPDC024001 TaxID=3154598 RepID=UPI0033C40D68
MREISESVVRTAYPQELEDFDAAAEWFRTAPQSRTRVRPPVGMGVEIASIVPVVLSAVSLLAGAVFNSAVEDAAKYLTNATREKLGAAFRRSPAAGPLTPEQEQEVFRLIRDRAAGHLPDDEAHQLAEAVIGALRLRVADET